ncbi:MAG: hypothetical protein EAX95_12120 [Candidatus Thorarchaeota archaeon]|nr:hypothetical protein [Candidatus Thorarchaeota archaeon]
MTAKKDAPKLYIAVDASKLARCAWCGTSESQEWLSAETGVFCSVECARARYIDTVLCIIGTAFVIAPLTLLTFFAPLAPIILILTYPALKEWRRIRRYKKDVAEGSRRKDDSIDLSLLHALPTAVTCPSCDGNINLFTVKEDMIYHCEYCGVSGKVEILKTKSK